MKKIDISLSPDNIHFCPTYRTRIMNCLESDEISTIAELCRFSSRDILRWRNMGRQCVKSIEDSLAVYGLRLGMCETELDKYMEEQKPGYLLLKAINWDKRVLDLAKEIYLAMPLPRTHDSALQAFDEAREFYATAKDLMMPNYFPNK